MSLKNIKITIKNLLLSFKKFFRKIIFESFFSFFYENSHISVLIEVAFKTIQISIVLNCLSINAPSLIHAPSLKYPFNRGGRDLNNS